MKRHVTPQLRQQDADTLAKGYTRAIRLMDYGSVITFLSLELLLVYQLWGHPHTGPWLFVSAVLLGYLAADFVSGFVHWMADTWGSTQMRWIGKSLIRPFREHHVDEKAITRHDFIETNGNNCAISIPVAIMCVAMPHSSPAWVFVSSFLGSMIFWVMATNQFHKWSHLDEPPPVIAFFQRVHLILPPAHHHIHHTAPYHKYYCITVGWLNKPLTMIAFFPTMERLVTWATGLLPRQDDIGSEAAIAIVASNAEGEAPVVQAAKALLERTEEATESVSSARSST
jgi:hypothetical protein